MSYLIEGGIMVNADGASIERDTLKRYEYGGQEFLVDVGRGKVYIDLPRGRGTHEVENPIRGEILREVEK